MSRSAYAYPLGTKLAVIQGIIKTDFNQTSTTGQLLRYKSILPTIILAVSQTGRTTGLRSLR
eukprot:867359-Amorphochlora_amoeboformis.AAC.1